MSRYGGFNEQVFRSSVENAMKTVEQILEANRNPKMAGDVDHKYENKYNLAEQLSNMAIASHMNCFEQLGLTLNILQELKAAASSSNNALSQSVTLRFQAAEACTFLNEQIVEVPSSTTHKTEETEENTFGGTKKTTSIHSFMKRVKEYHWKVDVKWIMRAFWGSDQDQGTELQSRSSSIIVVTQSNHSPIAKIREHPPIDILLNWFVQHIDPVKKTTVFHIQTNEAKTPRRNAQVDEALDYFNRMEQWASHVRSYFAYALQRGVIEKHDPVVKEANDSSWWLNTCASIGIPVPILPIMDDSIPNDSVPNTMATERLSQSQLAIPGGSTTSGVNVNMTGDDCIKLLNEHVRSLEEKVQTLQTGFPSSQTTSVVSSAEAKIVVLCVHMGHLSVQYKEAIDYIEDMLEKQLFAAIGKRVTTTDLEEFVRYHNSRFLQPPPKPFCYSIGRPQHYPYGVISLEKTDGGEPIHTLTRQVMSSPPLKVQLTAATTVNLTGKTHLHGWMNFRSQGENISNSFRLVARARQFSSFLLVVGTMMGVDELQPKDAIIIQNKDEVMIPLLLNELPSAKEFKDAIQSLSPEQRRFAEAFRSMQLSSSVFGIAVIQIKPQLEKLLGIPEDSLAKEIKLTQDLMELFVEHQVPSDLLSYDGEPSASVTSKEKVDVVKSHVESVLGVINSEMENQLEKATMKADMAAESSTMFGAPARFGGSAPQPFGSHPFAAVSMAAPGVGGGLFGTPPPPPPPVAANRTGAALPEASSSPAYSPPPSSPSGDHHHRTPTPPIAEDTASASQNLSGSKRKTQHQQHQTEGTSGSSSSSSSSSSALDFSAIPKALNKRIEQFDKDSALRSTVIKTTKTWTRRRQENLLKNKPSESTLSGSDVRSETNHAFDLLDALSCSGALSIPYSELHVVLCASHCFQKSVADTIIQDNVNPIERLELSTLLLGSVIHGATPCQLVTAGSERQRIESTFPAFSNLNNG
ncbi:unnamed protein product [Cylindrotheca closterium]|uniref:Uncharacterized protein n=1 Tax=Cylindrotheca closterium TaxID=2856 RepID=A0AAD2PWH5_9STRA|nr:unnamed protein product [Cylindrotheca closterium]